MSDFYIALPSFLGLFMKYYNEENCTFQFGGSRHILKNGTGLLRVDIEITCHPIKGGMRKVCGV